MDKPGPRRRVKITCLIFVSLRDQDGRYAFERKQGGGKILYFTSHVLQSIN